MSELAQVIAEEASHMADPASAHSSEAEEEEDEEAPAGAAATWDDL